MLRDGRPLHRRLLRDHAGARPGGGGGAAPRMGPPADPPGSVGGDELMPRDQELAQGIIRGDRESVVRLTREELDAGREAVGILNEGLIPGMDVLGERLARGEAFIPELMAAAKAMNAAREILRPLLEASGVESLGKVVMGTVKGDMHDIGKNLVCMMLRGAGFEVIDLGVTAGAERFIQAIEESGARLLGMSALLTTTMSRM